MSRSRRSSGASVRGTGTALAPPFLRRIYALPDKVERGRFPFSLPMFRGGGFELELTHPVTLLVGENGTGKSTLLEAIARNSGFGGLGGGRHNAAQQAASGAEAEPAALLDGALRFAWLPKVPGFFFRAESFFGFVDYLEKAYADAGDGLPWGERSLKSFSHGESFLVFLETRLGARWRSIYLLDEPEAALSPERQLEFLAMLAEQAPLGTVQYVIATHSPLLMACPGADIRLFTWRGIRRARLREVPHFERYDAFFRDPEGYVGGELARILEERRAAREEEREEIEAGREIPSPLAGEGEGGG